MDLRIHLVLLQHVPAVVDIQAVCRRHPQRFTRHMQISLHVVRKRTKLSTLFVDGLGSGPLKDLFFLGGRPVLAHLQAERRKTLSREPD